MLTTTIDGLWVLQVLTGLEVLAPELGLRPTLPSLETPRAALAHPVAGELRAAGVIDASGAVDDTVVEWLTVLARRDIALLMRIRTPDDSDSSARAVLARFARWWVVLERSAELVRISGAGSARTARAADAVLTAQLERLCGSEAAAPIRPVTLDADALLAAVTDSATLRTFLDDQQLDTDQVRALADGADPRRARQATLVAIQTGVPTGEPLRTHIEPGVVTVIDTCAGRLVTEHVASAGKKWLVIAPGTATTITAAVNRMLCRLPAEQDWHSYRKVV